MSLPKKSLEPSDSYTLGYTHLPKPYKDLSLSLLFTFLLGVPGFLAI